MCVLHAIYIVPGVTCMFVLLRLLNRIVLCLNLSWTPCIAWLLLHLLLALCDRMNVLVLCFNLPLCTPCVAVGTGESADTPARDPYSAGDVPPGMPGSTPTTLDLGEGALSQSTPSRSRRSTSTSPRRATVLALLPWLGTSVQCICRNTFHTQSAHLNHVHVARLCFLSVLLVAC